MNVKEPTNGSLATLNANAENFSFSSNFIVTFSSDPTFVPSIEFKSLGLANSQ